jgi:uncharacterized protein YndB with AHSA1/START domain
VRGQTSGSTETFVPAPVAQVWEFLADPARLPEWEMSITSLDDLERDATVGAVWQGRTPNRRPDGRPVKVKPAFRRRAVELVAAHRPDSVAWKFSYPDGAGRPPVVLTTFALAATTGGTQVAITTTWSRPPRWWRLVTLPLRPLQKFLVWVSLFQIGSSLSRAFR